MRKIDYHKVKNSEMKKHDVMDTLRRHEAELRSQGITSLYLFGSTVRDKAEPTSDIDLFFDYEQSCHLDLIELINLKNYVSNLFPVKVDFMSRDSIHPLLYDQVTLSAEKVF